MSRSLNLPGMGDYEPAVDKKDVWIDDQIEEIGLYNLAEFLEVDASEYNLGELYDMAYKHFADAWYDREE